MGNKDERHVMKLSKTDDGYTYRKTKDQSDDSNVMIGAKHEFGIGVPMRSFLRMPLQMYLQKYLENNKAFTKEALAKVIKDKSIIPWIKNLGVTAEQVVLDAFEFQGWGHWPPLSPRTMEQKKVHMILTETQQLRNSITHKVVG
jgi:hypothetical protein